MKFSAKALLKSKFKAKAKQYSPKDQQQDLPSKPSTPYTRHDSGAVTDHELYELPTNPGTKTPDGLKEIRRRLSRHAEEPEAPSTPDLLGLPARVRIRIYEFSLPLDDHVRVPAAGTKEERRPPEPALLQVCKEIREEASEVYYTRNTFTFTIQDFNASALITWLSIAPSNSPRNDDPKRAAAIKLRVFEPEQPGWKRLLEWLYHYYRWEVLGLSIAKKASEMEEPEQLRRAREMFREVDRLRKLGLGRQPEWEEVVGVLDGMRGDGEGGVVLK